MADVHGEITPYLDAIGTEDGSEAMITAMEHVGTRFTIDEFTSMGMHEKYLEFAKGGVEFLVLDGVVDTIFFRLIDGSDGAAYRDPDALIPGLRHGMPREAVIELLGEPLRNEPNYLLYTAGAKFLNVQVRGDHVEGCCVQARDLQAEYEDAGEIPAAPIAGEVPAAPITGKISLFIDAAGTAYGSPAMSDLIAALGSSPEVHQHDDEHGSGRFLVFENGIDVQYRNETLLGVLIHTGGTERRTYPHLDALVDGLSFPAARGDVVAALGSPRTSLADRDIYSERGRFVMFHYTGDAVTTVSIVHTPASS